MKIGKFLLTAFLLFSFIAPSAAINLEEGVQETSNYLGKMSSSYKGAVENGTISNPIKYHKTTDYYTKSLESYHNMSNELMEVSPRLYTEGEYILWSILTYVNTAESPEKVNYLIKGLENKMGDIVYISKEGEEETPQNTVDSVEEKKVIEILNVTIDKLSHALVNYKKGAENGRVINRTAYQRSLFYISDTIDSLKENQGYLRVTESSEEEYYEALSALYTVEAFMKSGGSIQDVITATNIYSAEEKVDILENFREEEESSDGFLTILVILVIVVAGILFYTREMTS